jgi:hypothetical protein
MKKVFIYEILYFNIFAIISLCTILKNFSIKLIRQFREQITESITEKYYFPKSRGTCAPWNTMDPPPVGWHYISRF